MRGIKLASGAIAAAFAAFVYVASICVAPSAFATTKLIANSYMPRLSVFHKVWLAAWAKDVEKATEGRIKIAIPTASLAPPARQWDIVEKGVADISFMANYHRRSQLHLPLVAELPFTTPNSESTSVALWRTYKKYFESANEYEGMKLLALVVPEGFHFQSTGSTFLSVRDLKGRKIRTNPGTMKRALDSLGATVVSSPGPKSFELISKGIVDGSVMSHGGAFIWKYARYLKNVTVVPSSLGSMSNSLFMNGKVWNKLSTANRAAIEGLSYERHSRRVGKALSRIDALGQKQYKKYDVKMHQAPPTFVATLRQKLAFLDDQWISEANRRNVDGRAALAFFRTLGEDLAAGRAR